MQGQQDAPLSDRGIEQSQTVAKAIAGRSVAPVAVYASDLSRASDTAKIIAAKLGAWLHFMVLVPVHRVWQGEEVEQQLPLLC